MARVMAAAADKRKECGRDDSKRQPRPPTLGYTWNGGCCGHKEWRCRFHRSRRWGRNEARYRNDGLFRRSPCDKWRHRMNRTTHHNSCCMCDSWRSALRTPHCRSFYYPFRCGGNDLFRLRCLGSEKLVPSCYMGLCLLWCHYRGALNERVHRSILHDRLL